MGLEPHKRLSRIASGLPTICPESRRQSRTPGFSFSADATSGSTGTRWGGLFRSLFRGQGRKVWKAPVRIQEGVSLASAASELRGTL